MVGPKSTQRSTRQMRCIPIHFISQIWILSLLLVCVIFGPTIHTYFFNLYTCIHICIIISHLSILQYCISQGITRIFSLPEGYKGKQNLYFPPSGYHSDQSEPLFTSITSQIESIPYQYYCHTQLTTLCSIQADIVYRHGKLTRTDTCTYQSQLAIARSATWQVQQYRLSVQQVAN